MLNEEMQEKHGCPKNTKYSWGSYISLLEQVSGPTLPNLVAPELAPEFAPELAPDLELTPELTPEHSSSVFAIYIRILCMVPSPLSDIMAGFSIY